MALHSKFGIPTSHYRPSRKMIDQQHEDTKIDYDATERSQLFHVELSVSTSWMLSFLAVTTSCKHGKGGSQRTQASKMLKQVLHFCNITSFPALVVDPALLHACNSPWRKDGWCRCCFKAHSQMLQLYGQHAQLSVDALVFFFREATDATCLSMKDWRTRVVMELTAGVNTYVLGARKSTVSDMPVLISPSKARRLTTLRAVVGTGLATNEDGVRIYKTGGKRCVSEADAEKQTMASYLYDGNSRMGQPLQVGFTADCSTCSGRDTLSVGAYTKFSHSDNPECAMWMPCQGLDAWNSELQHQVG